MIRVKSESVWETLDLDQIALSSGDDDSVRASPRRGASQQLKKGPWTPSENAILEAYVKKHGVRNWNAVQKDTGLLRCGKSCRLRWTNHLRPDLKKGTFTKEEEKLIIKLHRDMGNKWARIAAYLPGRTDNEIKNYWNTRIKKCWRTVTPIYPANICPQASNEYQHESTEFSFSEKLANDLLHGNGLCVPDFTWDNFIDDREGLSYAPYLPDASISNLLGQNFASKNYGFMDQVNQGKVLKEFEISPPVLNATINGTLFGSHAFSNGSFSASRPTTGPSKMELPSFQYYAESDPNNWSTYSRTSAIQRANFADLRMHSSAAILAAKFESMCMSPRNSGQSEELLPEAHALSSVENQQLSVGSLSSSIGTSCDAMMESSELGLWEQDPNFCTLTSGCLSAPPLCPTSPDEFQNSEISCAHSPVFGSSEPAAPQYVVQGEFSPHREDSRLDALFSWNIMNTLI